MKPLSICLLASALAMSLLQGCRRDAPEQQEAENPAVPAAAPATAAALEDVIETDPRYILGISYPPAVNRYPGLAAELRRYADAARSELMGAVAGMDGQTPAAPYDLSLAFSMVAETPQLVAVAADGSSYTGGAHGNPLVARFVWLPQRNELLRAEVLLPDPRGWQGVSDYVAEQLHAALSQRIDADDLDPAERVQVVRSAGRMIDEGTGPEAGNFQQFEPVLDAGGRLTGLRFVFPPYQVGPYSDGVQTVEVPARVLLPYLAPTYRDLFVDG